jgi:hypothetical protein
MIGSEEALLITKWIVRAVESIKDHETERVRFSCTLHRTLVNALFGIYLKRTKTKVVRNCNC